MALTPPSPTSSPTPKIRSYKFRDGVVEIVLVIIPLGIAILLLILLFGAAACMEVKDRIKQRINQWINQRGLSKKQKKKDVENERAVWELFPDIVGGLYPQSAGLADEQGGDLGGKVVGEGWGFGVSRELAYCAGAGTEWVLWEW